MQLLNRIIDSLSEDVLNGTGGKTSKFLLSAVITAFVALLTVSIAVFIFICIALLIQSYTTGSITHQTAIFSFLNVTQGIKEFNYRCWLIVCCLSAASPMVLPILIKDNLKTTKYQYFLFSTFCIAFSWLVFIGTSNDYLALNFGQYWGELFLLIGCMGSVFCSIEEKNSRGRIYFTLFMFAGLIVQSYYIKSYP